MALEFRYNLVLNYISHENSGSCRISDHLNNELIIVAQSYHERHSLLLIFFGSKVFYDLFFLGVENQILVLSQY